MRLGDAQVVLFPLLVLFVDDYDAFSMLCLGDFRLKLFLNLFFVVNFFIDLYGMLSRLANLNYPIDLYHVLVFEDRMYILLSRSTVHYLVLVFHLLDLNLVPFFDDGVLLLSHLDIVSDFRVSLSNLDLLLQPQLFIL